MTNSTKKNIKRKYSYADYIQWDNDKRYEIIEGVVYDMNAPLRFHQEILVELSRQFANYLKNHSCKIYVAPFDVRLPKRSRKNDKIHTVIQPDISIVCDKNKLDKHGCVGAPDLIVEILSPSTASKDHIKKRRLYEQHKVNEYWLVDPSNRIVTIYNLENKSYGKPQVFNASAKIIPALFPELEIDMSEVFPKLPKVVCENPPPGYIEESELE